MTGRSDAAAVSRSAGPAITDPRWCARDDDIRPEDPAEGAGRGRIFGGRARGVEETAPVTRRRTGIGRAAGGGPRKATPTTGGGTGSSTLTQLPGPGTRRSARRPQERAPPPPPLRFARRSILFMNVRVDRCRRTVSPFPADRSNSYFIQHIMFVISFVLDAIKKKNKRISLEKRLGNEFNTFYSESSNTLTIICSSPTPLPHTSYTHTHVR